MRVRATLGLLIPLACAALFIRLGLWQRARHLEKASFNEGLAVRLALAPVPFESLPSGPEVAWRRVSLDGRFRYDLEQVLAGRTNNGSPGVHLLTPFERPGSDTLVMVTRGWVYSANAGAVDLARWREADRVSITGYVTLLEVGDSAASPGNTPAAEATPAETPSAVRPLRTMDHAALQARVGAPVAFAHVVMTSDSVARADSVPRRLALPVVDGGPHFSYMMQWFAFALIAIVGGIALFRRSIVRPVDTA